jgi:hypothetical protein
MNKLFCILILVIVGCQVNLRKEFLNSYSSREKPAAPLNSRGYFISTINLDDSLFMPYEYFVFFTDGTLFTDAGSLKNGTKQFVFSIESINSKRDNIYNWGYYTRKNDSLVLFLPDFTQTEAVLSKDTLYLIDNQVYGSKNKNSLPINGNGSLNRIPFIYKPLSFNIDSSNILMKKNK